MLPEAVQFVRHEGLGYKRQFIVELHGDLLR